MVIDFPVFAQDRDKWMYVIDSEPELDYLESIDVDGKEYVGWDAKGLPIEFYMDNRQVRVRAISDVPELGVLREAILEYATIAKPDVPFSYLGEEDNIGQLFEAVEKHVGEKRVFSLRKR